MRYYCSYFDRNYLARALVLLESLENHETQDFKFIAICLDELTRTLLKKINNPHVVLLALHDIENSDPALTEPRRSRTPPEYFWTLGPTAIRRALEYIPEGEPLYYIDADLCFFSNPAEMLSEMDGCSVLIHEHRYSPRFAHRLTLSGRFNVGLVGFRNDPYGREVLDWWRLRCIEWCFARNEEGKFGDQMYLDDWPNQFKHVRILQHAGAGVAPWNQESLRFQKAQDAALKPTLLVNDQPLVFFHFHSLVPINPNVYLLFKHEAYKLPMISAQVAYHPYTIRIEYWNDKLRSLIPTMQFGYWPEQPLYFGAALLVRDKNIKALENLENIKLSEDWSLIIGTQIL